MHWSALKTPWNILQLLRSRSRHVCIFLKKSSPCPSQSGQQDMWSVTHLTAKSRRLKKLTNNRYHESWELDKMMRMRWASRKMIWFLIFEFLENRSALRQCLVGVVGWDKNVGRHSYEARNWGRVPGPTDPRRAGTRCARHAPSEWVGPCESRKRRTRVLGDRRGSYEGNDLLDGLPWQL